MSRTLAATLVALAFTLPEVAVPLPEGARPAAFDDSQETAAPDAAHAATSSAPRSPDLVFLLAESDQAYVHRDDPARLAALEETLAQAEKLAPGDFRVLWRLARLNVWLADDPKLEGKEKSRVGKIAWDYGDRATAADPARVEGWYWSAAGMGLYGLGIGVFTALRQGIEPKLKERMGNAERIDSGYNDGAIEAMWGRFYFKLPWPKYDAKKSEARLRAALKRNPANVRAHVYLAELLSKEDRDPEAKAQLEAALARPPGQYDPPEERRWQEEARRLLGGR